MRKFKAWFAVLFALSLIGACAFFPKITALFLDESLAPGNYRELTDTELAALRAASQQEQL